MCEKPLYHDILIVDDASNRMQQAGMTDEVLKQVSDAGGLNNMECVQVKLQEGVENTIPVGDIWLLQTPGPAWNGGRSSKS